MTDFSKRSYKKEILDLDTTPFKDIKRTMEELDFINTYLGGHAITLKGFKKLLQGKKEISVCETGCGGGDNLDSINKFCKKKAIKSLFAGIDINKDCIAHAKKNCKIDNVDFIIADYEVVQFETAKPAIIFSSLFCHHFSDNQLIKMLLWMNKNSTEGFFINDLQRHPVAYYIIKAATKLFSKSRLVKNDAPLSVLRGFKKSEWKEIFKKANIENYTIEWKWAFRYLIIVPKLNSIG